MVSVNPSAPSAVPSIAIPSGIELEALEPFEGCVDLGPVLALAAGSILVHCWIRSRPAARSALRSTPATIRSPTSTGSAK